MQITGIVGLIDIFGGSDRSWKDRIQSGMPVAQRSERGKPHVFNSIDVFRWLAGRGTSQPPLDPAPSDLAMARLRLAHELGKTGMPVDAIIGYLNQAPGG